MSGDVAGRGGQLAVDELVPADGLRDDVAIVAMQHNEIPAELHLRLPADPRVLADIRHVLRRWLRNHGVGDQDTARITLSVNEACTNAIEHAYSPPAAEFELRASASDGDLTIVVSDAGQWRAPRGPNRGHGLAMIDAAMDEVEINAGVTGTEVVMRKRARA